MEPKRWVIATDSTSVTFHASSSVHPIKAIGSAGGWFQAAFDEDGFAAGMPLHGELEIPLGGLSSGNPLIDRELRRRVRSGDDARIIATIDTTEDTDGATARITGTIRFLDAETLVEGEITLHPGPRLKGVGEFDVRWWGMEPPRLLMLRVDPIVTVEIDLDLHDATLG